MLIDAHLHILAKDGFVLAMIQQMDVLQEEKGLVLALPDDWIFMGARCGGNDDVLNAVKQFPDRLIGGVYLDPRDPDVLDTLRRYVDHGFRAVKVHPTVGFYMDDPICLPVYEEIQKLRLPIVLHAGLTNVPYVDTRKTTNSKFANPIYIDGVIRLFPQINWIIAHMGWPFFETVWGLVQYNDNVYMDLSGPHAPMNGLDKIAREGLGFTCDVDLFERMIWGSDGIETERFFNMIHTKLTRMNQDRHIPTIFGGTIARLLGLAQ